MDLFIKSQVTIDNSESIYIDYDFPNINTGSETLTLTKYGHTKDNSDLSQMNLSVGYYQTDKVLLFYEFYLGVSLVMLNVKKIG